ncbi:MAG: hypothetical protein FWC46_03955 [Actinomycetia bacterium]|nr:hypothetical protein [Actinomycetes bacterium]
MIDTDRVAPMPPSPTPPSPAPQPRDEATLRPRPAVAVLVLAAVAAFVVLVQTVIPLIAVPMAERDVTALAVAGPGAAVTTPSPGAAGVSGAGSPATSPTPKKMDGLGIRTLPLISDAAWAAFQKDPDAAIQEYGQKAFGDTWPSIWAATPFDTTEKQAFGQQGSISPVPDQQIASALALAPANRETDVLNLVAVLELAGAARPHFDDGSVGWRILFVAIARAAADHFGTCNSRMAHAHAVGLRGPAGGQPFSERTSALVSLWEGAITACPTDPTPAVELAKSRLTGGEWPYRLDDGSIDGEGTEDAAQMIVAQYPDVPASHLLLGDTYRMLDRTLPVGSGMFTHRYYLTQAMHAYSAASAVTSDPTPVVSLADAQLANLDASAALATLASLNDTARGATAARAIKAAALARSGDARSALTTAPTSSGSDSPAPILTYSPNDGCGTRPQLLLSLEPGTTATLFGYVSGCGAGDLVYDQGYIPISREDWSSSLDGGFFLDPLLPTARDTLVRQYAALADEPDAAPPCRVSDLSTECLLLRAMGGQSDMTASEAADSRQDLQRYWGDLDGAAQTASAWIAADAGAPEAFERLGEIRALQGRWPEAVRAFETARALYGSGPPAPTCYAPSSYATYLGCFMTGQGWTDLKLAAGLARAGQTGEAQPILATLYAHPVLSWEYSDSSTTQTYEGLMSAYAILELGQLAYDRQDYQCLSPVVWWGLGLAGGP